MTYKLDIHYSDGSLVYVIYDEEFDVEAMVRNAIDDGMDHIEVPTIRREGFEYPWRVRVRIVRRRPERAVPITITHLQRYESGRDATARTRALRPKPTAALADAQAEAACIPRASRKKPDGPLAAALARLVDEGLPLSS